MQKNKYYQLINNDDGAELYIFGDITQYSWDEQDKNAWSIVKDLQSVTADKITVHINSYGGEVSEGLAIYNVLRNSGKEVTTMCDGFACSIASVIFMAGSKRVMNKASLLMIHNAWTIAQGDASDLRKSAEDIDIINKASIEAYKAVATIPEAEIEKLMNESTWITPEDAVSYGFATEINGGEEKDPQQSAFSVIMQKLTEKVPEPMAALAVDEKLSDDEIKAIADKITKQLKADKPKQNPKTNTWESFFHKGD